MDRDKRWERIQVALEAIVDGKGEETDDVLKTIDERYAKDETDEFFKPIIVNGDKGRIKDGDTLFFFNYRSDRMREIVTVLGQFDEPIKDAHIPKDIVSLHSPLQDPMFIDPVSCRTSRQCLDIRPSSNFLSHSHLKP